MIVIDGLFSREAWSEQRSAVADKLPLNTVGGLARLPNSTRESGGGVDDEC